MQSHRLHTQEEELHGLDPFIRPLLHKNKQKKYGTNIFALVFHFKLKWKKNQNTNGEKCPTMKFSLEFLQLIVLYLANLYLLKTALVELWFSHKELKLWFHLIYCLEIILKPMAIDTNKAIFIGHITFKKHWCLFWLCELRDFWAVFSDLLVNCWLAIAKAE